LAGGWASLCQEYFGEPNAGENFYSRLESLRHSNETRKRDLLEVYYLCLALGFQGRLGDTEGVEKRKVLMDGICRELRGEGAKRLSVQVASPDRLPGPQRSRPSWLLPFACVVLVGALYGGLAFALARLAA
jgi:type VI secretion system protein ImpK